MSTEPRPSPPWRAAAVVGGLVALSSTAAGALVGAVTAVDSPVAAVAGRVIDAVPKPVREWAIETFGTKDKLVLGIGIVVILTIVATFVARAAVRRPWLAPATVAVFALVGTAATSSPSPGTVLGALASALAAYGCFAVLVPTLSARQRPVPPHLPVTIGEAPDDEPETPDEPEAPAQPIAEPMVLRRWDAPVDRRAFVARASAIGAGTALLGGIAAAVNRAESASVSTARRKLPAAPRTGPDAAAPVPASATAPGAVPFITPNDDFYQIDTAFVAPRVDLADWTLTIDGAVDRRLTLTYDDLLDRHMVERVVTLCCVSNEVGGHLVGTAKFLGVPLAELLEEAGVQPAGEQVAMTSVDGWTCGFPTKLAMDGRDALVAVGMNGEPLPVAHGFPARVVVPGLYGYVSATKWVRRIHLTGWDDFDGYWIPRGWAKEGPVKTQSRIDVPHGAAELPAGKVAVAGVAWAQHRGIERVEVRVDDGPWREARLADEVSVDTWRQWVIEWDATPGEHRLSVRATDGEGDTQPAQRTPVAPDGATGHHTVTVTVV